LKQSPSFGHTLWGGNFSATNRTAAFLLRLQWHRWHFLPSTKMKRIQELNNKTNLGQAWGRSHDVEIPATISKSAAFPSKMVYELATLVSCSNGGVLYLPVVQLWQATGPSGFVEGFDTRTCPSSSCGRPREASYESSSSASTTILSPALFRSDRGLKYQKNTQDAVLLPMPHLLDSDQRGGERWAACYQNSRMSLGLSRKFA